MSSRAGWPPPAPAGAAEGGHTRHRAQGVPVAFQGCNPISAPIRYYIIKISLLFQWFRSQPVDTVHKDPKVTGSILATCKKGFLSGYEIGIVGSAISLGIVQLFNQLTT